MNSVNWLVWLGVGFFFSGCDDQMVSQVDLDTSSGDVVDTQTADVADASVDDLIDDQNSRDIETTDADADDMTMCVPQWDVSTDTGQSYRVDNDNLVIANNQQSVALRPGASTVLAVRQLQCCYPLVETSLCETWSIEPESGVTLGQDGSVTIDPNTPAGTTFVITASFPDSGSGFQLFPEVGYVQVYDDSSDHALVGRYRVIGYVDCATDALVISEENELAPIHGTMGFLARGEIHPRLNPNLDEPSSASFAYTYDETTNTLSVTEMPHRTVAEEFDGEGSVEFDLSTTPRQVVLRDIWLGDLLDPIEFDLIRQCGYVLEGDHTFEP